jgi:type IV pilus assembly protein PilM
MTVNYGMHYLAWDTANTDSQTMKGALAEADGLQQFAQGLESQFTDITTKFDNITKTGQNLHSNVDGRLLWLEMLKAVHTALPKDPRPSEERKETPEDVASRPELRIKRIDCEYVADLALWFNSETVKSNFEAVAPPAAAPAAAADGAVPATQENQARPEAPPTMPPANASAAAAAPAGGDAAAAGPKGPTGPGWVIEIEGYHFHNELPNKRPGPNEGRTFVLNTFCNNLQTGAVELPDGENGAMLKVPISDLGIGYPVIIKSSKLDTFEYLPVAADAAGNPSAGRPPVALVRPGSIVADPTSAAPPENWKLRRYDFTLQFCWAPTPRGTRQEKIAKQARAVATAMRDQPNEQ